MAHIDFSNAQLEMPEYQGNYAIISQPKLLLFGRDWWMSDGNNITPTATEVTNTPTKYAVRYQGTIPWWFSGGVGTFISISYQNVITYKITGIQYSVGDDYDFTIEVELTPS